MFKKMAKKAQNKSIEMGTKLWITYKNARGEIVVSHLGITILIVVAIFGVATLFYGWFQGWFTKSTTDISNNGGVNEGFGKNVKW